MCARVTITLKPCISDRDSSPKMKLVLTLDIFLYLSLYQTQSSEKNDHTRITTKASLSRVNIVGRPQQEMIHPRFGDCVIIYINCGLGPTVQHRHLCIIAISKCSTKTMSAAQTDHRSDNWHGVTTEPGEGLQSSSKSSKKELRFSINVTKCRQYINV